MQLKTTSQHILNQIFDLIAQLSSSEYTAKLDLLNGNSIGKHVRHVLEFFDLMVAGCAKGRINYDKRNHAPLYETDTQAALAKIESLIKEGIEEISFGEDLILEVSYSSSDSESIKIKSSVERELAYNIEHAIHHMAIMKIAAQTVFPKVKLAENFGVAYSTVRYQKSTDRSPKI